jgi:hypothetical protein
VISSGPNDFLISAALSRNNSLRLRLRYSCQSILYQPDFLLTVKAGQSKIFYEL